MTEGGEHLPPSICWVSSCPHKCPCLGQRCLLKPREESASSARAGGLQGLPHPGRAAGLFHRQSWTADEQKESQHHSPRCPNRDHRRPWGSGRKRERREEGGRWHQQWPPALNLLPRSPLITSVEAVHALLGASEVFMG